MCLTSPRKRVGITLFRRVYILHRIQSIRGLWNNFGSVAKGFLLPGEGLPGRVWLSRQYEQITDATAESESYCLRNQPAKAFDISAGLGVPIIANDEVQAVLVFFKLEG
jgi:hypothetical protein